MIGLKIKRLFVQLGSILPVFFAVFCLISVVKSNNQSFMPIPNKIDFIGEYSVDGENWQKYTGASELSAFDGTLTVKGRFSDVIFEGGILNVFCNHIG